MHHRPLAEAVCRKCPERPGMTPVFRACDGRAVAKIPPMQILGVQWRKPTFKAFTEASVIGLGLWLCGVAAMVQANPQVGADEVGALLVMVWWFSLGARMGLDLRTGLRPLLVNLGIAAVLLACYSAAWHWLAA